MTTTEKTIPADWPNPELKPGLRLSYRLWTDVLPVVVVERTRTRVGVKVLPFERKPGAEPMTQSWIIGDEPREGDPVLTFTLRKNGRWKLARSRAKSIGSELLPGCRVYYDYSF